MTTKELLSTLIKASEKAANIARICRENEELFNLLIEEKTGNEKNERFVNDFKTLADVVIQETIKHDVGVLFPQLRENIKGEESNKFENILGESVVVSITEDPIETKSLLLKVLDGNEKAAEALAVEVHKDVSVDEIETLPDIVELINIEQVGIWIDPIDGTAEYINGNCSSTSFPNIEKSGLKCATILIGAYNMETSKPFMGVVNQPFFVKSDDDFKSKIFWGASINGENHHNIENSSADNSKKIAIISSAETRKPTLESAGYKTVIANGAGYKILKVIENDAGIYFLSKNSTFKWDTCAGQAILNSIGGDVIDLQASIMKKKPISLTYKDGEDKCNRNGLIAYRSVTHLINLIPSFL
ncbi:CLUMA_CG008462, isoform A [Clunio marinus]|uniref:inositol-1,4-bisphosphate 1-phosphatase n=1 Tax=Clunio marinus TaxID=568069 RepID=A0A1J1I7N9_9DIPT|nr:CLUMA_CG008462, isoform A [Clunio marinus]